MSISSRIREARIQLGMTQMELAQRLGVTKSAVSNYESGVSSPKEAILFKMFDVLECDANYLYQDELRMREETRASSGELIISPEDEILAKTLYDGLIKLGYLREGEDITPEQLRFLDGLSAVIQSFFEHGK